MILLQELELVFGHTEGHIDTQMDGQTEVEVIVYVFLLKENLTNYCELIQILSEKKLIHLVYDKRILSRMV